MQQRLCMESKKYRESLDSCGFRAMLRGQTAKFGPLEDKINTFVFRQLLCLIQNSGDA
jgi:hypothetical protein